MTKKIRTTLWILSSLAILWTVSALVMAGSMGAMMAGGTCPMCGTGMSGAGTTGAQGTVGSGQALGQDGMAPAAPTGDGGTMSGMMGDGTGMGSMMWMMVTMGLTWVVMLGLDGIFVYLVVTARRATRSRSDMTGDQTG